MRSRPSNRRAECADRGSATVLGAALITALLVITVGVTAVGSAVVARHNAQAGADLAALAAAAGLPAGTGAACARAGGLAAAMSTPMTGCVVDDLDVVVTVEVAVRVGRWDIGSAQAAARAGPLETVR
jgi:secretion/DNA translocation related TadE-like protein